MQNTSVISLSYGSSRVFPRLVKPVLRFMSQLLRCFFANLILVFTFTLFYIRSILPLSYFLKLLFKCLLLISLVQPIMQNIRQGNKELSAIKTNNDPRTRCLD